MCYDGFIKSLLLIGLCACSPIDEECGNYSFAAIEDYKVNGETYTHEGIHVDADENYDLSILDRVTNEVYSCLQTTFPSLKLSSDVISDAWCFKKKIRLVQKSCFEVKIPSDWRLSCDGSQQVLKDEAPVESCKSKGLNGNFDECPCSWRAGIQQKENTTPIIVTTPNLYLYKDPLLRYITSCDYPWSSPPLSTCMSPSTRPLDLNLRGETNEL